VKDSIQIFCSTPRSVTFRKFGSPQSNSKKEKTIETNQYELKIIQPALQDLSMESITLEEQKREKIPRISGQEALILLGLAQTRITSKSISESGVRVGNSGRKAQHLSKMGHMSKSRMMILDVRPPNEFKKGALPESCNIPFSRAYHRNGSAAENNEQVSNENDIPMLSLPKDILDQLNPINRGGKVICVVGNRCKDIASKKLDEAQLTRPLPILRVIGMLLSHYEVYRLDCSSFSRDRQQIIVLHPVFLTLYLYIYYQQHI
jgi:rhodanese-related sulfurtransferase